MAYRIRNWEGFQHYTSRTPPWIKLHRSLLTNREWHALSGGAAKMLVELWLIASEDQNGVIHISTEDLAWRMRRTSKEVHSWVKELVAQRFIESCLQDASNTLATCSLEREGERERETETEVEAASAAPQKRKWTFVPKSWEPTEAHRRLAVELGVSLKAEVQAFRDHEFKTPKSDADRAFNTWLRNAAKWASSKPSPGSEAAAVRDELPRSGEQRTGRAVTVGGVDPEAERIRKEREDAERAEAWSADHPAEARAIADAIAAEMSGDGRWRGAPQSIVAAAAKGEFRRRVLAHLTPRVA
jgi:hypothetical protein